MSISNDDSGGNAANAGFLCIGTCLKSADVYCREGYNIIMEKKELRAFIREKNKNLTEEYRAQADAGIATRFLLYPVFQQVDSIFCYVSMENEPDTRTIIETAWQMGKMVTVPRCISMEDSRMEAVQIKSWDDLETGTMGIPEPKQGLPVIDGYKIALAVVPCVTADRWGGRLGHGAGFYDRWLRGQSMYKYCLCYEELLSDRVPVDQNDIKMDRVFTEDKIYNPRAQSDDSIQEAMKEAGNLNIFSLIKGLFKR